MFLLFRVLLLLNDDLKFLFMCFTTEINNVRLILLIIFVIVLFFLFMIFKLILQKVIFFFIFS